MEFVHLLDGIVRHNIGNYLTAIGAYTELLLSDNDMKAEDRKMMLEIMSDSRKKMTAELDFWREYELNPGTSWQSLGEMYFYSKQNLPEIKVRPNEVMKKIKIEASNLTVKVLEILIENSIRHARASEIYFDSYITPEQELVLIVGDNGVGIPASEKSKIFEKGFGKNTGMGLFLAREILNITDITITEEGEPGKGALFKIVVPKDHYQL